MEWFFFFGRLDGWREAGRDEMRWYAIVRGLCEAGGDRGMWLLVLGIFVWVEDWGE
jgi:hypothetical protein